MTRMYNVRKSTRPYWIAYRSKKRVVFRTGFTSGGALTVRSADTYDG